MDKPEPLTREQERAGWFGDRCLRCEYTIRFGNLRHARARERWRVYCKSVHEKQHATTGGRP